MADKIRWIIEDDLLLGYLGDATNNIEATLVDTIEDNFEVMVRFNPSRQCLASKTFDVITEAILWAEQMILAHVYKGELDE